MFSLVGVKQTRRVWVPSGGSDLVAFSSKKGPDTSSRDELNLSPSRNNRVCSHQKGSVHMLEFTNVTHLKAS